jgi:hypothetical protein
MRLKSHYSRVCIALLAILIVGCGGSSSSSTNQTAPLSGVSKRVLASNVQAGLLNIIDAKNDILNAKTLAGTSVTKLITANGFTIGLDSTVPAMTIIDNATEVATTAPLGDQPFDVAISPDGTTAWAAERNFGFVQSVDTTTFVASSVIRIPNSRRLVMSPNGTKLLVFPDPQGQVQPNTHTFFIVDTASKAVQMITDNVNLDEPFTAVFGSSETQAFVMNCGAECGGTAASVTFIDFTGGAQNVGTAVPVPGATVGLLSGTTLYVAGTPVQPPSPPVTGCALTRCGALTALNVSNPAAISASAPVAITDGLHEKLALTSTGRVYVGASGCTVQAGTAANSVRGCLSIFNTSSSTVTFPEESSFRLNFDVTGFQPISKRTVIYVVQGGALDIFDTNADAVATGITPIEIIGKAGDVVQIDP